MCLKIIASYHKWCALIVFYVILRIKAIVLSCIHKRGIGTNMNNKLIFLGLIITTTQSQGMKRHRKLCENKQVQNKKHQKNPIRIGFPDYEQWPQDIQNIIIDFSCHNTVSTTAKEATKTIRALAVTNKQLNLLINNSQFSNSLIENLAYKFYCSHETIAKYLGTKEATKRRLLQTKLKQLCLSNNLLGISQKSNKRSAHKLEKLIKKGVNLEFTYNPQKKQMTPLMLSIKQNNTLFELLLSKKIDINRTNSYGLTALCLATKYPIHNSKQLILHPDININQQNRCGESALLHSIINRERNPMTNIFIDTIKALLKAGADPNLANNDGLTPLAAAIKLNDEKILKIITKAIEKKQLL